jgi:hypothetical protein
MDKNVEKGTREEEYQNIDEIESSKYCKSLSVSKVYKHGFHFHGLRGKLLHQRF